MRDAYLIHGKQFVRRAIERCKQRASFCDQFDPCACAKPFRPGDRAILVHEDHRLAARFDRQSARPQRMGRCERLPDWKRVPSKIDLFGMFGNARGETKAFGYEMPQRIRRRGFAMRDENLSRRGIEFFEPVQ